MIQEHWGWGDDPGHQFDNVKKNPEAYTPEYLAAQKDLRAGNTADAKARINAESWAKKHTANTAASNVRDHQWGKEYLGTPEQIAKWGTLANSKVATPAKIELGRWSIGYDVLLNGAYEMAAQLQKAPYPPYNVSRQNQHGYNIDVAVAGFKKGDIEISHGEGFLTISSVFHEIKDGLVKNGMSIPKAPERKEVLHRGIAKRSFSLTFALAPNITLSSASLTDGLLSIFLLHYVEDTEVTTFIV